MLLLLQAPALLAAAALLPAAERPWLDAALAPPQRAALVLAKMSQAEKLAMLHGNPSGGTECFNHTTGRIVGAYCAYTGNVGSERLGIPLRHLSDGPQGFPENTHPGSTTQFPSGLTVAELGPRRDEPHRSPRDWWLIQPATENQVSLEFLGADYYWGSPTPCLQYCECSNGWLGP